MKLYFDDEAFDGQLQRSVGKSDSGMANVGECLAISTRSRNRIGTAGTRHGRTVRAVWSHEATRPAELATASAPATYTCGLPSTSVRRSSSTEKILTEQAARRLRSERRGFPVRARAA
jgi:hypothetical protein